MIMMMMMMMMMMIVMMIVMIAHSYLLPPPPRPPLPHPVQHRTLLTRSTALEGRHPRQGEPPVKTTERGEQ